MEPVSNTTVPSLVAGKVASVEHRQVVEMTTQDRGVPASKKEAETNRDKQREEKRLEALTELHDEIMKQSGVEDAHLRIQEDQQSGRIVYQTIDNESGEVKKQYPADEILRSIRYLRALQGLMVDRRA